MNEKSFFEKVYDIVRKIPHGKVTSYGAIAEYLGAPRSARMVGWAVNKSELQIPPVPAHRVVNRKGLLTGKKHFANMNTMQELLESEGVQVKNNAIVDLQKHFWSPID
jgi:methylated-DNA-protein-cysteine methyltransferase-like protein